MKISHLEYKDFRALDQMQDEYLLKIENSLTKLSTFWTKFLDTCHYRVVIAIQAATDNGTIKHKQLMW